MSDEQKARRRRGFTAKTGVVKGCHDSLSSSGGGNHQISKRAGLSSGDEGIENAFLKCVRAYIKKDSRAAGSAPSVIDSLSEDLRFVGIEGQKFPTVPIRFEFRYELGYDVQLVLRRHL